MTTETPESDAQSGDLRTVPVWFDYAPVETDGRLSYEFVMITDPIGVNKWCRRIFTLEARSTGIRRRSHKQTGRGPYENIMSYSKSTTSNSATKKTQREAVSEFLTGLLDIENWELSARDADYDPNGGLRFRLATEDEVRQACE